LQDDSTQTIERFWFNQPTEDAADFITQVIRPDSFEGIEGAAGHGSAL
jgi:hypothetical protein